VNGIEIKVDEKIKEVKIVPISTETIPPYTFKTNA
jgi:hypothetical protein